MNLNPEHGIIILQPYADQICCGVKSVEYRKKDIPKHYLNVPLYLLSKGYILAIIEFTHSLMLSPDNFGWNLKVLERIVPPRKIEHKNGCQVWVRNVNQLQTKLS
jgi:hypothetical protein